MNLNTSRLGYPAHPFAKGRMKPGWVRTGLLFVIAVGVVLIIAFPYLWIAISSFRNLENFLSLDIRDSLPKNLDLSSYRLAFGRAPMLRYILNSLFVASVTTILSLLVSAPAAFALARLQFRFKSVVSWFTILSYAVPSIVLVVPTFVILVRLGINNSYVGLILVHTTFTIPFSAWVLRDFYLSIPADLEEAGYIDGASIVRVLRYIILPLSVPGLLAAGVYSFILSWNNFLFALVILSTGDAYTAPIGIRTYYLSPSMTESLWAQLMAASTVISLPTAILFGFFQRYLVSGFLSGAVKG